jgi:hypothetical protein
MVILRHRMLLLVQRAKIQSLPLKPQFPLPLPLLRTLMLLILLTPQSPLLKRGQVHLVMRMEAKEAVLCNAKEKAAELLKMRCKWRKRTLCRLKHQESFKI